MILRVFSSLNDSMKSNSSRLKKQECGMPAPLMWQHQQMGSLSGRQHRLSRVQIKQQQQKKGQVKENKNPQLQKHSLPRRQPWFQNPKCSEFPEKDILQQANEAFPVQTSKTVAEYHVDCRAVYYGYGCFWAIPAVKTMPRVQLNLKPVLQTKCGWSHQLLLALPIATWNADTLLGGNFWCTTPD